ncbi:sporulation-delaying protein SdpB family protein [Ferruginibacter albus]|uniref:sporulation-delaying protein SdpB family protein n=1 Tax=Ferruginibacter albus TaxID=2875540 RepID=UPI001CC41069|nr:sporulation-delaying protein SdpB family protein [Ferruginibacter albus]UAY50769.1 HTTM domain-containing protein [Ferruginibacter albus]
MQFHISTYFKQQAAAFRLNSPFTKTYGVARTFLAIGSLLILLCNSSAVLFDPERFSSVYAHNLNHINLFILIGYKHLWFSKALCIIVLLSVITGIYPQLTGFLHWWVSFSLFNVFVVKNGGDQLACILTFFLFFIAVLDKRKNHWYASLPQSESSIGIGNIILFIIKLQVFYIYLDAALGKLASKEWLDGTAMYYWVLNSEFGTSGFLLNLIKPVVMNRAGVAILTWGTIVFELLLCAGILFKPKARFWLMIAGIFFHFLIFIFLGLGSFFFAMTGSLVLYLYPGQKNKLT